MKNTSLSLQHLVGAGVALAIVALASTGYAQSKGPKLKPYPLKTCLVSGEKLGEMGTPYVFIHQGREIKFCCKGCLKDFNKETAKYIKKLEAAEKAAKEGPAAKSDSRGHAGHQH